VLDEVASEFLLGYSNNTISLFLVIANALDPTRLLLFVRVLPADAQRRSGHDGGYIFYRARIQFQNPVVGTPSGFFGYLEHYET
jgi:hypothetical protein